MPCYQPLGGARLADGTVRYRPEQGQVVTGFARIGCGQCIGCRLGSARSWATRAMHEASLYDANCFITLTYDDEHLPADYGLEKKHWQLFAKSLRRRVGPFRYLHCGEYGDRRGRPHGHACLFGVDFRRDRQPFESRGDHRLFVSPTLSDAWGRGLAVLGALTFESAAYVARYVTKKRTGPRSEEHYERAVDIHTGEVLSVQPEYHTMSRNKGLGYEWFQRYWREVYPIDRVVMNGREHPPPAYYDRLLEQQEPELAAEVKARRVENRRDEENWERMRVMERVEWARLNHFQREIE